MLPAGHLRLGCFCGIGGLFCCLLKRGVGTRTRVTPHHNLPRTHLSHRAPLRRAGGSPVPAHPVGLIPRARNMASEMKCTRDAPAVNLVSGWLESVDVEVSPER